jgi:hypothetical protein
MKKGKRRTCLRWNSLVICHMVRADLYVLHHSIEIVHKNQPNVPVPPPFECPGRRTIHGYRIRRAKVHDDVSDLIRSYPIGGRLARHVIEVSSCRDNPRSYGIHSEFDPVTSWQANSARCEFVTHQQLEDERVLQSKATGSLFVSPSPSCGLHRRGNPQGRMDW